MIIDGIDVLISDRRATLACVCVSIVVTTLIGCKDLGLAVFTAPLFMAIAADWLFMRYRDTDEKLKSAEHSDYSYHRMNLSSLLSFLSILSILVATAVSGIVNDPGNMHTSNELICAFLYGMLASLGLIAMSCYLWIKNRLYAVIFNTLVPTVLILLIILTFTDLIAIKYDGMPVLIISFLLFIPHPFILNHLRRKAEDGDKNVEGTDVSDRDIIIAADSEDTIYLRSIFRGYVILNADYYIRYAYGIPRSVGFVFTDKTVHSVKMEQAWIKCECVERVLFIICRRPVNKETALINQRLIETIGRELVYENAVIVCRKEEEVKWADEISQRFGIPVVRNLDCCDNDVVIFVGLDPDGHFDKTPDKSLFFIGGIKRDSISK